jgi:hypothetical protein
MRQACDAPRRGAQGRHVEQRLGSGVSWLALCAALASCNGGGQGAPVVDASSGDAQRGDASDPPESDDASSGGSAGEPSWLIESGDSVFFVGNSFFGGDDNRLADLVTSLGKAMQPPIEIRTGQHVVYGNQPLSWFFDQPESQNAIQQGSYKIFVLQGEEREPVDHESDFKQAVRDYHRAVTDAGGKIMLFMTWDFYWERDSSFFANLSSAYEELGRELNVPVIPVGLIYDDTNKQPFGDEKPYWLTGQELHQNDKGTVANVYATFEMLTGLNPMGTVFDIPYDDPPVPEPIYRYLSDKTWARVAPRLHD